MCEGDESQAFVPLFDSGPVARRSTVRHMAEITVDFGA
jgi:hypothetical protein